jgi:transposase
VRVPSRRRSQVLVRLQHAEPSGSRGAGVTVAPRGRAVSLTVGVALAQQDAGRVTRIFAAADTALRRLIVHGAATTRMEVPGFRETEQRKGHLR